MLGGKREQLLAKGGEKNWTLGEGQQHQGGRTMGLKRTEKGTEKADAVSKKKTLFRTFLDDFEVQQFDISERAKEELEGDKWTVISLYTVDVVLCFTIIGEY